MLRSIAVGAIAGAVQLPGQLLVHRYFVRLPCSASKTWPVDPHHGAGHRGRQEVHHRVTSFEEREWRFLNAHPPGCMAGNDARAESDTCWNWVCSCLRGLMAFKGINAAIACVGPQRARHFGLRTEVEGTDAHNAQILEAPAIGSRLVAAGPATGGPQRRGGQSACRSVARLLHMGALRVVQLHAVLNLAGGCLDAKGQQASRL
jgi:hypothetical protein